MSIGPAPWCLTSSDLPGSCERPRHLGAFPRQSGSTRANTAFAVFCNRLSCLFLCCYSNRHDETECRDYPVLPAFLKRVPYKSPSSVLGSFPPVESCSESSKQASLPLPAFVLGVAYQPFAELSRGGSARRWAVLQCSSANAACRRSATASRCPLGDSTLEQVAH